MLKKMYEINDFIVTETGIIETIQTNYPTKFTWLTSDNAETLDMEYYLNHSGDKFISPLTYALYEQDETTYLSKLAKLIVLKYEDKWNKLYKAFFEDEYNPIENYSMIEDENVNSKIVNKTNGQNNIYGFNTTNEDGVPQDNSNVESSSEGDFDDNHRRLSRSGNIGVTTSQQMLQSEIDLRQWEFYEMLMNDIDEVMCLAFRRVR